MHVRQAALQADLAMDGIPRDANGLNLLKTAAGTPSQRAWALWSLGGLGNRGVDPAQAAGIIESYLGDPDARVRMAAVNGLAILGTDQTIPVLLDRFRNDSSALVQEQVACGLAESGMYTHEQRMVAAGSLVRGLPIRSSPPSRRNLDGARARGHLRRESRDEPNRLAALVRELTLSLEALAVRPSGLLGVRPCANPAPDKSWTQGLAGALRYFSSGTSKYINSCP